MNKIVLFALLGVAFPVYVVPAFDSQEILEETQIAYNEFEGSINPLVQKWNIDEIMVVGSPGYANGIVKKLYECVPNSNVNIFIQSED